MCHSTAEKREVPSEGKRPPQCYEVALLTLRVSIVFVVRNRAAVVSRRCADPWCPAEPGMGRQCLVAPVRAPLSVPVAPPVVPVVYRLTRTLLCLLVVPVRVPVRGCACVLPLKPWRECLCFSARPLSVLARFVPARSLRLVAVRPCPACAWNDSARGSCCPTISPVLSPIRLSKTARKSQGSRAPWHSL